MRGETRCNHFMGYSFWLASQRQDSTYHYLCYANCGVLARTRNSSMGSPWGIDPTTYHTVSGPSTMLLHLAPDTERTILTSLRFQQNNRNSVLIYYVGCSHSQWFKHMPDVRLVWDLFQSVGTGFFTLKYF